MIDTKLLAFYLPQFHPIEENDVWWGKGFTEWVNVSQARPRFKGHYQPHVPGDLGFYDLRLGETRLAQANLARYYGIHGFCYYHYWFNGKLMLQKPLSDVLSSGEPDFPFCLCWANENWTRAWDGLDRELLIKQDYTDQDAEEHIKWFIKVFLDKRYIKIDGRPLLLIYRLDNIPDVSAMLKSWRSAVEAAGFPGIHLCAVKNGNVEMCDEDILELGFDSIVDFQPNRRDFPSPKGLRQRLYTLARKALPGSVYQRVKVSVYANKLVDYRRMVEGMLKKPWPSEYRKYPCVFPSWDNSARRTSATIIQNDDPALYGKWLSGAVENVKNYPESERIVFINAWNEWAEGCHLEPDRKYGMAFLEQTRDVLELHRQAKG